MFRRFSVSVLLAAAAVSLVLMLGSDTPLHANQKGKGKTKTADKDKKDDLVGARWKVTIMENDKVSGEHRFRADKYKLYNGAEEIGTYAESKSKEDITLEFASGPMAGKMEVKQIKKNATKYAGEWKPKDGGTKKVTLELLND